jgi:hypothetical protein
MRKRQRSEGDESSDGIGTAEDGGGGGNPREKKGAPNRVVTRSCTVRARSKHGQIAKIKEYNEYDECGDDDGDSSLEETPLATVTRYLGGSGLQGIALVVFGYYGVLDFLLDEQKLVPAQRAHLDILVGRLTEPHNRDRLQIMPIICGPGNALVSHMLAVRWPDTRMTAPCARFPNPLPFVTPVATTGGNLLPPTSAPSEWIAIYTEPDLAQTVVQSHISGEIVSLYRRRKLPINVIYPHGVAFVESAEYDIVPGAMARRLQIIPLRHVTSLERFKDVQSILSFEILLYIERARVLYIEYITAHPNSGWWQSRIV